MLGRIIRRITARRRGDAIWFVLLFFVLLGMAALAVDVGHLWMSQAQLQLATDSAADAGASAIDGTGAGLVTASDRAVAFGNQHLVDGESPQIAAANVTTGVWDWETSTFAASGDPDEVNAVRVVQGIDHIDTIFGLAAFGVALMGASAASTSALPPLEPATEADCFLPLAIADCRFARGEGAPTIETVTFQMTNADADNVAWALPQPGNPSDAQVVDLIRDGFCDPGLMVPGVVSLNSGAMANAFRVLADAVNASPDAWDTTMWGPIPDQQEGSRIDGYGAHVAQGAVMMFEPPAGYCVDADGDGVMDGGSFNEDTLEITGLAWGIVFDVKGQGGGGQVCTGQGRDRVCTEDLDSAGNVRVRLDLDYDAEIGTGGDGGYPGGVVYQPPARFVQ